MWYVVFALSLYTCIYTASYGLWEWKRSKKGAAVAVWFLCGATVLIPFLNIIA